MHKIYTYALGFILGVIPMLCLSDWAWKIDLDAVPYKYMTCSNLPGIAAHCIVPARFSSKEACENFLNRDEAIKSNPNWKQYCK
jgi:hypothetical protein